MKLTDLFISLHPSIPLDGLEDGAERSLTSSGLIFAIESCSPLGIFFLYRSRDVLCCAIEGRIFLIFGRMWDDFFLCSSEGEIRIIRGDGSVDYVNKSADDFIFSMNVVYSEFYRVRSSFDAVRQPDPDKYFTAMVEFSDACKMRLATLGEGVVSEGSFWGDFLFQASDLGVPLWRSASRDFGEFTDGD